MQDLLDVAYGFYMAVVVGGWDLAIQLPGSMRNAWMAFTFKERMASALCSTIIFIVPADYLYESLTLLMK
jgi:hypothetical protein